MRSLADGLPAELAAAVDPRWRKNEADYWAVRESLLERHRGRWIGFADGRVVAEGGSPVQVLHEAFEVASHPYVTCVGDEYAPCQLRRSSFPYDAAYPGEPLPLVEVEFRPVSGTPGIPFDRVIPDTGADSTALPWADFLRLQLDLNQGIPSLIGGVAGSVSPTFAFRIWVFLDGQEYPCRLQLDMGGRERILGRDVLNRLEILFRGPARELVVNP
jgi:hypothetical protein